MIKGILIVSALTGLFSCWQISKSRPDTIDTKTTGSATNVQSKKTNKQYFHSTYNYTDPTGARLTIENSFPKSGIKYTDPTGKNHVYAVFWTRITNETANPFELALDFSSVSFELPASSGNYVELLVPSDTMTLDKEPLFDYGLAVKSFLDSDMHKAHSLRRTIPPHESSSFYVIPVSNRGAGGTVRTGLRIDGQNLVYKINDKEIVCGRINFQKLLVQN